MRVLLRVVVVAVLVGLAMPAMAAEIRATEPGPGALRAPGERSAVTFDRAAYQLGQRELHQWLMSERVAAGIDRPVTIRVSREEMLEVERGDVAERRVRVGLTRQVAARVDLATLELGALRWRDDGGLVWTGAARSEGATALRVHLVDVNLPHGAELFVYNLAGEAFGPYTGAGPHGTGEFWSHTISGDEVAIQLHLWGPASAEDVRAATFSIAGIGHIGPKFLLGVLQQPSLAKSHCPDNEPCVEDASCYGSGDWPAINDVRNAVAYMEWVSGAWIYMCSGGLLADTDESTQIPYFLTANHCISKDRDAGNLECFWQYWTSSCGGACYDPVGIVPRTLGASVVESDRSSDYTLLQLAESPPAGSYFLGWTAEPVAYSHGTELYRLSHPNGSPQAFSKHTVDTDAGVCRSWPRGNWIYSRDVIGATEGGSSGSPVLTAAGQVVGQLSGGCGTNVNDPCDAENNATVDGAFAAYFSDVAPWLDPVGCDDADNDGYNDAACGGDDCNDADPDINPGAAELCADGIDNDCDDLIDAADPDCGGTCKPKGDPCTSDDECCSLKCKGKPGAKTCN